ncbi:hypothetical protein vBYenM636_21 [Yersinia phage vB_YenM_636]|nr:hypothetical protein X1_36 [Yersinia phage vB_Yen_X1]QKN86272.1 hypothetical protein vBYenM12_21 [Yersinia phage vB_YenM_12]QKN86363.1 hypothetical protein vBYenM22_21 [Yersinia phage vB_YenM_22]QKN86454.1 hypothetical protein vBYenM25_21 [Yersinia phage vB_YenM_25]QKN86545.1 hypothetical protein vBYenM27_21 [Yersinia phage vB_YenM_27]QKN86636.1 hypothetical protein vBYenM39_21 [Yersinia phage vB_YenM_39]QKN86727.1 hypothetical protein vBYenM126_21 [Yersinia phage vB_YenM_126]QKN86818.1 h
MVTDEDMQQLDEDYLAVSKWVARRNQLKAYVNQYQVWLTDGIKCEKYLKRSVELLREHEETKP